MSKHIDRPEHSTPLRHQAEARIREGDAPQATHRWSTGVEALTLLYGLASTPESAGDALKLLHELQVYQVELDLQYEQMELSQRELAGELHRYTELYHFAPVAYFIVDVEGNIINANLAAAQLFNANHDDLSGRHVNSLLAPESRPALLGLWKRLRRSGVRATFEVQAAGGEHGLRALRAMASASPDGQSFLLALTDQTKP
jgi:PAS domain S-box-containing protein